MPGLLGTNPINTQPGLLGLPGYPGMPQLPAYMQPQVMQGNQPQTPGQFQQQQLQQGRGPSAFGGADQIDRGMQQLGRGQADMTLGNMARMVGLMSSVAGPMGAFSLAAKLARNPNPFTGYMGKTPAGVAVIKAGGTITQALAADRSYHVSRSGASMANNAIAGGLGMHVGHPGGNAGGGYSGGGAPQGGLNPGGHGEY